MSTLTNGPVSASARVPSPRGATRIREGRKPNSRTRFLIAGLIIVAAIGYMIYAATQSASEYFVTATELKAMGEKAIGQPTKLGGRVVDGSIQWDKGANTVSFSLADEKQSLPVVYTGVVPDAFQPGVDVILEGKLGADGTFKASSMLAKCASKYEPK